MARDTAIGDNPARPAGGADTRIVQKVETQVVDRPGPTSGTRSDHTTRDRDADDGFRGPTAQRANADSARPDGDTDRRTGGTDRSNIEVVAPRPEPGGSNRADHVGHNTDRDGNQNVADDDTAVKLPDRTPADDGDRAGHTDHKDGDLRKATWNTALDTAVPGASLVSAVGESSDRKSRDSSGEPTENQQQGAGGTGHDAPLPEPGEHGDLSRHGQQGEPGRHGEQGFDLGKEEGPRMPGGQGTEVDQHGPENQEMRQDGKPPGSGGAEKPDSPDPAEKGDAPSTDRLDDDSPVDLILDRIFGVDTDWRREVENREETTVIRLKFEKDGSIAEIHYQERPGTVESAYGFRIETPEESAQNQDSRHGHSGEADDDDD